MSKDTKGPWFVTYSNTVEYGECIGVGINTEPSETPICIVSKTEKVNSIDKENARLIAAAPELLEALEYALPMLHTGDELPMSYYKDKPSVLGKALRAIAKAKGENND